MKQQVFGGDTAVDSERPARRLDEAMWRGFKGICPHCGEGRLFRSFLKTVDACEKCGEEIHHHRADDLPAYLVIAVVGHIVVGAFMGVEAVTVWPGWLHLTIWVPITILMSLLLLQPTKGAIVGLQWALYMHGFGGEHDAIESHPEI